jgi:flagellar motility protein MotE (MotC chaperone)
VPNSRATLDPKWSLGSAEESLNDSRADDICRVMAEYGEWNRKGAVLSDVTAQKEYGVTRDFIIKGIQVGKLEYREGAVWGNPYIRVLRSQLELYIVEDLGPEYLMSKKSETELRTIKKEIADLRKKLAALEARKAELERAVKTSGEPS